MKVSGCLIDSGSMSWKLKIFYDGECPFCKREVEFMKKRDPKGSLAFEDIESEGFDPSPYGLSYEDTTRVIHAVRADGSVLQKMEVFREAYTLLGFGWLLAPTGWPGLRGLFDFLYETFAKNRVKLGRWCGRSCEDACSPVPPRDA